MAKWYYYNANKEKIGPVTGRELKQLVQQRTVMPETYVEDPNGRTGLAKHVAGLTFNETGSSESTLFAPNTFTAEEQADIDKFCAEYGSDVNSDQTLLHKAIECEKTGRYRDVAIVKFLVTRGADVNANDKHGRSPLHCAIGFLTGNVEAVKFLVSIEGINVNAKDDGGYTPLYRAAGDKDKYFYCMYPLCFSLICLL